MTQQTLQASIWWILPGKLAGMRKPEADELAILEAEGIGAIISVMDDPSNLNLYEVAQIPYCWLPTKGGTAPTREHIDKFRQFVDVETQAGKAAAVHCSSGRRRTATFLGAYLILIGKNYGETVHAISHANSAIELSEIQLSFLNSLSNGH
jgi:atypical dual specificity phosphatase